MEFSVHIPFVQHLGFTLHKFEGGESELRFDPREEHHNSFSVVHGGASMTLLDVAMGHAARSLELKMGVVTIEMKTSFPRAAKGPLTALGKVLHRTATMAFTEGRIVDASGQLCAHATGTFKYVPQLPVGSRSTQPLNLIPTD
ncbi:PaaI family thioesterase [Hydrogenophaga sp. BPS33]|uniref:PaaI family thioesterase n=1 Tax=Hydrogenophaga sp. BPS33 TaxID=2651974 RepID=UPI00131FED4D|nr:PaaI family thioesterase [Hydrogenophaga sp. BPS33]QHE86060.1 PaaI family thioesterase [Hydrogenophaga sp. BPS33]